jgi:tetratricopeptide (TPR) repeat protein
MFSGTDSTRRLRLLLAGILILLAAVTSCRKSPSYRVVVGKEGYTHTISKGETLESIAATYYKDRTLGKALGEYNGIDPLARLEPGTTLIVPFDRTELENIKRVQEAYMLYNKGTVLARTGQYEEARDYLEAVVEADPTYVDAWYNLALVHHRLGDPQRAAEILRKLVNSFPSDQTYRYSLGAALKDRGKQKDALEQFKAAVELDPDYARAYFGLAMVYENMGDDDKAIGAWTRYLELDQESNWAEEARLHLEELRKR